MALIHKIDVTLPDRFWPSQLHGAAAVARRTIAYVLERERCKQAMQVTVSLSSDARVRVLNRNWRGKDKPTNVLSFPMHQPTPAGYLLGDIVLARQTLVREARQQGKSLKQHYVHLLIHGTLHLLGYDHENDPDADVMEAKEIKLLAGLGIPDPYPAMLGIDKVRQPARMRSRHE